MSNNNINAFASFIYVSDILINGEPPLMSQVSTFILLTILNNSYVVASNYSKFSKFNSNSFL